MGAPVSWGEPLLAMVGVDHRIAPVEVLAALGGDPRELAAIRARCGGVVALSTCHRRELYLEGAPAAALKPLFFQWVKGESEVNPVIRCGEGAVEHLLRVAAGLESAVLGEDQILAQVRAAYRDACAGALAGPLLHRLFHAAFRAGKRVRSETELASGGRSLAGSAVNVVERRLGGLAGATVLVLGAGEMASIAAARLHDRGTGRILVCSRTHAHAAHLAAAAGADALPWEWREQALGRADAAICAVSAPAPVITAPALLAAVAGRRFVAVDLGLPANLPRPAVMPPGVEVIDLDGMRDRLARQASSRAAAVAAAEGIVAEETAALQLWLASRARGDVHSRLCCRRPAAV